MNIVVKARHMDATESIRQHVESRAAKLSRYYDRIKSVEVILDMEAEKSVVEIIAQVARRHTFVATARDDDMYASVDQCMNKVAEQLRRYKDKVRDHQGPPHGETAEHSSA